MTQIVADDFNRANGALGANWTVRATGVDSGFDIVSNQCKASSASGEGLAWFSGAGWTGGADQYAEAKIIACESGKDIAIACRVSGLSIAVANAYLIDINSNDAGFTFGTTIQCSFYKQVAGAFTQIGTDFGVVINASDIIRLEVQGTSLRAYKNGIQISTTQTDSSLSSGNPGLYVGSGTTSIWDDFAAGDFSVVGVSKSFDSKNAHRPAPFKPMGDAFRGGVFRGWR